MRAELAAGNGTFAALTFKSRSKGRKSYILADMPGIPMVTRVEADNMSESGAHRATVHFVGGLAAIKKNIRR